MAFSIRPLSFHHSADADRPYDYTAEHNLCCVGGWSILEPAGTLSRTFELSVKRVPTPFRIGNFQ